MPTPKGLKSFKSFWPYYLAEHRWAYVRYLHYTGTILSNLALIYWSVKKDWRKLILVPLIGYGFAWLSHLMARNKPATFTYPLWSFMGDYKMLFCWLTGTLDSELTKHHAIVFADDEQKQ